MAKNKQEKMGHAKAEVRAAVTVKTDDGSHGHTCPHCSKAHRHIDPKCQFIGLAYLSCPECLAIGGDPFAGQEPTVSIETRLALENPSGDPDVEIYLRDKYKEEAVIAETAPGFEEAVKATDPGDSFEIIGG